MAWLFLLAAGAAEIVGVTFLKLSEGFTRLSYSVACLITGSISFYCLSQALVSIPVGTAYAIWTGIGTAGSVLMGMLFFRESRDVRRIFFISCIVAGIVGLKFISE